MGTEFVVSVIARLTDGSPLSNAIISVNVTKSATTMLAALSNRIINLLGNSDSSVEAFASLVEQTSHAIIDPSRCTAVTDSDGEADFYLLFEAGVSGNYSLKLESAMSSVSTSEESEEFILVNPIGSLLWLGAETRDLIVDFGKEDSTYQKTNVTLPENPKVALLDSTGTVLASHKVLKAAARLVDYSQLVAAAEEMSVDVRNLTLSDIASSTNISAGSSAMDKIKRLWETVTRAGAVVGTLNTLKNEYAGNYSALVLNETDWSLEFQNVTFALLQPGTYMLVLEVDGVEAKTELFNIKDKEETEAAANDTTVYEDAIAYTLVVVLVLMNVPYIHRAFMVTAIGLIVAELYFVTYTNKGTQYQVFVYIILSLIAVYCVYLMVEELVDHGRNGFACLSDETALQYVRHMFKTKANLHSCDCDSMRELAVAKCLSDIPPIPLWQQLLRPFIPFYFSRRRRDDEAFYYPQRLILALLLGVLTFVYVEIELCQFALDLFDQYTLKTHITP